MGRTEARAAAGASLPSAGVRSHAVTAVLFTCAGQRVDIVERVRPSRGDHGRDRRRPSRAGALPRRPQGARAAGRTIPDTSPRSRRSSREHDVRLIVPLTDLDQELLSRSRDALAPALVLAPAPDVCRAMGDKWLAHVFFDEHGIDSPRSLAPGRRSRRRALPAARQGARGLRLAPHLSRRGRGASSSSISAHPGRLVRPGAVPRRGVLDRRLLRPRRPVPQRDPADDDPVEGRRVDQGPLDRATAELIAHGARGRRDDRDRRARPTSSASASPTARYRSPTSTHASAARSRCRSPRAAGIPDLALALARGERPEPRLGDFRDGVVMTRFFSDLCLIEDDDGDARPVRGGASRAARGRARGVVSAPRWERALTAAILGSRSRRPWSPADP